MAGLSMGSLQTSITAFEHSELFSYVGVFSGFVQDILTQNQSHLTEKIKKAFEKTISYFLEGLELKTDLLISLSQTMNFLKSLK